MKGLNNWKFEDVVAFLKDHEFTLKKKRGSHHYFVDAEGKHLTHIQYHAGKTIFVGTMKTVIQTSGIDEQEWRKWSK